MEDHEVIIYNGQAANNPAYDGWSGGAGPGRWEQSHGEPGQTEEEALSGGPNLRWRKIPGGSGLTYSASTGEGPGKS